MGTRGTEPSSEAATEFSGAPGLSTSTAEDDVVVQIGSVSELHGQQPSEASEVLGTSQEQPFDRFRRRLERFRGLGDAEIAPGSLDDESELRLQVMLLREENARLKAARHEPAGAGSAIDRIRLLNSEASGAATADDAWAAANGLPRHPRRPGAGVRRNAAGDQCDSGATLGTDHEFRSRATDRSPQS